MMIDREDFYYITDAQMREVQACRTYVKYGGRGSWLRVLRIADQVCENKFIFNLPWGYGASSGDRGVWRSAGLGHLHARKMWSLSIR